MERVMGLRSRFLAWVRVIQPSLMCCGPSRTNVRPPLPGIEHERKRQPRLAADRVMVLELPDLLHRPGVEPVAFRLEVGHVAGRIPLRQLVLDREGIDLPQRLDKAVGGLGPVGHLVPHVPDVARLHQRVGLRSVLLANPVEDAAPDVLGAATSAAGNSAET